jgi:cellulose 1,4-beta-cellobiosidase
VTVVTQFVTSDGTDNGDLKEVRRFYVQNGRVIQNSKVRMTAAFAFFTAFMAFLLFL